MRSKPRAPSALFVLLALVVLSPRALASDLEPPRLVPAPTTPAQDRLVREGVALHDRGDYDGAIRRYEQVLAENESHVGALYEMSFAYTRKKEYRKSLEAAYRGARYKSDLLGAFYMQIGNNLDELGEPKKAVDVYKAGIKLMPESGLLYYNLGLTYRKLGKPEDARKVLKAAVSLDPKHASSHLLLAAQFYDSGYRIPALFAAARFLALEPGSPRSGAGVRLVREVLSGGARQGKSENEVNVFVQMGGKTDEGDFGPAEMMLGLGGAAALTGEGKKKTEAEILVGQLERVVETVSGGKKGSSFVHRYYVPYFVEMKEKNFLEPFVYYTLKAPGGHEEAGRWVAQNSGRVMQFLTWSKNYPWPKDAHK